jgi:hypothetical protein
VRLESYQKQASKTPGRASEQDDLLESIGGLQEIMRNNERIKREMIEQLEENELNQTMIQQDLSVLASEVTEDNQSEIITKLESLERYDTQTQNSKIKAEAINLVKIAGHKHQKILEMGEIIEQMKEQIKKKDQELTENQSIIEQLKSRTDKGAKNLFKKKKRQKTEIDVSLLTNEHPTTILEVKRAKVEKIS